MESLNIIDGNIFNGYITFHNVANAEPLEEPDSYKFSFDDNVSYIESLKNIGIITYHSPSNEWTLDNVKIVQKYNKENQELSIIFKNKALTTAEAS